MIMMHGVGKERNNLSFSDIGIKGPCLGHTKQRGVQKNYIKYVPATPSTIP